ncbi:MAG TPA: PAS domain S-box protein [Fimbriimonadaceae bacterium]|nr:PAS domain S-box protein [Fimbriimonadaceae bacterium]
MRKVAEKVILSPREEQLIALAGQGLTDTAIANKLGISEATVNTYWGRIRVKLGPHNRTELVALALREEYERRIEEMRGDSPEGPDYSLILQAAPDALILTSDDGTISNANVAASEMFGYDIDELIGMNIMALIPHQYRGGHDEHVAGYLSNPERRQMGSHMGVVGLRKDGVEFQMAAALSSVAWNGKSMAICSIRHVAG